MTTRTLSAISAIWPAFPFASFNVSVIRPNEAKTLKAETSNSGSGMLLLKGIEVMNGGQWFDAHLSLPPGGQGFGYVEEGHLKIEGGMLLNQYFFTIGDHAQWEVLKASNSKKVKTSNPGKWEMIDSKIWTDVDKIITKLLWL